jgi:hypothetical protein
MSSLTHPRGRLPARVYWVRRGLVLGSAAVLVFGFAHLLGSGGGGGGQQPRAQLTGSVHHTPTSHPTPSPQGPVALQTVGAGKHQGAKPTKRPPATTSKTPVVLASPDGPCAADDISARPEVDHASAGGPVDIRLQLTATRPACTFDVSSRTVAVKITSGPDSVWSSQLCRRAVPKQSVVVRSAQPAVVPVTWSGRRSDGSCGPSNDWARPGYYHVIAAVIGSAPTDTQFKLSLPPRPVVTKTAHPKPRHTDPSPSDGSTGSTGSTGKGTVCGGDNAAGSC